MMRREKKKQPQSREHEIFGRAVKELRARRDLSQEELGQRSGLHRNYVGAIERGEINPTLKIMRKLITGLDVQLSDLVPLYEARRGDRPLK